MKSRNQSLSIRCVRAVSMTLVSLALLGMMASSAHALDKVSELLDNPGFQTLLSALNAAELTSVLDENTVTLFAPTDDAFEETADALKCDSVEELLTNLQNFPVGGTNALAAVLSYHAFLGRLNTEAKVLSAGKVQMISGKTAKTGVNQNGLYIEGKKSNKSLPTITTGPLGAANKSTVYAIDRIILPIEPPKNVCR